MGTIRGSGYDRTCACVEWSSCHSSPSTVRVFILVVTRCPCNTIITSYVWDVASPCQPTPMLHPGLLGLNWAASPGCSGTGPLRHAPPWLAPGPGWRHRALISWGHQPLPAPVMCNEICQQGYGMWGNTEHWICIAYWDMLCLWQARDKLILKLMVDVCIFAGNYGLLWIWQQQWYDDKDIILETNILQSK